MAGPTVNLNKNLKAKKRSGIKKPVLRDLHQDMNNMTMGSGWYETPLNTSMPEGQKYVMLETASGRVGESLGGPNPQRTYAECIRTATIALAWAQSMKTTKGKKSWAATK